MRIRPWLDRLLRRRPGHRPAVSVPAQRRPVDEPPHARYVEAGMPVDPRAPWGP